MADTTANDTNTTAANSAADATAQIKSAAQPYLDKATSFAKQRPFAAAALAGVLGAAFLGTLRGRRA